MSYEGKQKATSLIQIELVAFCLYLLNVDYLIFNRDFFVVRILFYRNVNIGFFAEIIFKAHFAFIELFVRSIEPFVENIFPC